ncbi:MAG: divalent-cation tolerance protein CutA [Chloroflexia bacterium]
MDASGDVVLIYCPCGSEEEAAKIASALLERQLIACANLHQTRSLYYWGGRLVDEQETVLLCKTAASRVQAAEGAIRELHSYDIPCVLRIEPAQVNGDYARWVLGEVSAARRAVGAENLAAAPEQA